MQILALTYVVWWVFTTLGMLHLFRYFAEMAQEGQRTQAAIYLIIVLLAWFPGLYRAVIWLTE
jgi:hypothetical protein